MISLTPESSDKNTSTPACVVLARYGAIPQVARFSVETTLHDEMESQLSRGSQLVVQSDRGVEVAQLLEVIRRGVDGTEKPVSGSVLRMASASDLSQYADNRREADGQFSEWQSRLESWQLQLQLVDIEWTLDREQIILYVLNDQNAETTRLALLAAAAGLGIIHVQPVAADGIVHRSGGGCGSGGCGSGGCGSGGCGSGGCGSGGCGH